MLFNKKNKDTLFTDLKWYGNMPFTEHLLCCRDNANHIKLHYHS